MTASDRPRVASVSCSKVPRPSKMMRTLSIDCSWSSGPATTERRSSVVKSSANMARMASQSCAWCAAKYRALLRVASFSKTTRSAAGSTASPTSAPERVRGAHGIADAREKGRDPFGVAGLERAAGLGVGGVGVAGVAQHGGQREAGVGDEQQRVGRRCELDGLPCERERARRCRRAVRRPRRRTSRHAMPALRSAPASALGVGRRRSSASSTRSCSNSARPRNAPACAASPSRPRSRSSSYAAREIGLGRDGFAVEQLDEAGRDLGLESPVGEAELFDRPPRRGDHAARRVDAAAQRFEHRLAAERDRLHRRRARR